MSGGPGVEDTGLGIGMFAEDPHIRRNESDRSQDFCVSNSKFPNITYNYNHRLMLIFDDFDILSLQKWSRGFSFVIFNCISKGAKKTFYG